MRSVIACRFAGCLALLLMVFAQSAQARSFDAHVLTALEGDTLEVLRGTARIKVRLAEVDAPEPGQPWGDYARQALADKLGRLQIRVDEIGRDRQGRIIGWVYQGERNINRELVAEGIAWAYERHLTDLSLNSLQAGARQARRGLWSQHPDDWVPPWEWRAGERNAPAVRADPSRQSRFTCGTKRLCQQMWTCEEARFYFENCGVRANLDPNGDGVPCESLCGR